MKKYAGIYGLIILLIVSFAWGQTVTNPYPIPFSYLDTDTALTANSDTKVPSQKAIKAYVGAASTTGSANSLKSPATTGLLTATGMGAGTTRAKTVRDADDTILELGGSYTPSATWNWTSATVTWPTFNQSTTGTAAHGTTWGPYAGIAGPTQARTFTLPDAAATLLYDSKASGAFGTASSATGSVLLYNSGNANAFTLQPGATGAALSWTFPIAAPSGNNYLVNASTAGILGYTDPATFSPVAGSASITTVGTVTLGTWNSTRVASAYGGSPGITVGEAGYTTFAGAVATLNSAGTNTRLTLPTTLNEAISSNLTSNSNIGISQLKGANLTINTGIRLTLNSPYDGDLSQKFTCQAAGSESLTNGTLTTASDKWTAANECTFAGNNATWSYVAGGASTLTQAQADLTIAGVGSHWYAFTYTVSGAAAAPAASITTAFALTSTTLDLTNGTHTTYFQAAVAPTNFVITATLTAGQAFSLDGLSLVQDAGRVILGNGVCDKVPVNWFNTNAAPGTTDMTTALAQATNAANGKMPVYFSDSEYLVTDTLALTVYQYKWLGKRSEKGLNSFAAYPATKIIFNPVDKTKKLIDILETVANNIAGPFEHENLRFEFGDANGFQFGDETVSLSSQAFNFGIRFINCYLGGTAIPAVTGKTITRSGKILVSMTKAFESAFINVSIDGSDVQVRMYECDCPVIKDVRSQSANIPLSFEGYTGGPLHNISNFQVEIWGIAAIHALNTQLSITGLRLETNPTYSGSASGKYLLSAVTATATAGSDTLTFSESMDSVLFPKVSVIEFTLGGVVYDALVKTVSGTTVTVYAGGLTDDVAAFVIPVSGSCTSIYRVHGYGVLHGNGYDCSVSGGSVDVSDGSPSFIMVASSGNMSIANIHHPYGTYNPGPSIVIGNRLFASNYLNQKMSFTGCDPYIIADPNHPMVYVDNWGQNRSSTAVSSNRTPASQTFDNLSQIRRTWVYTPKGLNNSINNSYRVLFERVNGDSYQDTGAFTSERVWAWRIGTTIYMNDDTLPSSPVQFIKVTVKTRAVSTPTTMEYYFSGKSTGGVVSIPVSTEWTTHQQILPVPSYWQNAPDTIRGLVLRMGGTDQVYVAGIIVEELLGDDWSIPPSSGYTAAPTTGTWTVGRKIYYANPSGLASPGCICVTDGTFSAATDNTGSTDGSTGVITGMTDTSDFYAGEFVTVSAGFATTGPFKILSKTAATMTVNSASNAIANNVTVATPDPTFKDMAVLLP